MLLDLLEVRTAYDERLREAAQERLAQQAKAQRPARRPAYLPQLMARTGDSLIALGYRLKKQSDLAFG